MTLSPSYCVSCGAPTQEQSIDGRLRPVCPACGHVTYLDPKLAVAVLIAQDGQVLLGKRGPGTRAPGKWGFPGGFVERGEHVESAAAREALEETGLQVAIDRLLGLYSSEGETVVLAVYLATVLSGQPHPADDLTDLAWFPFTALPDLAFPRDHQILTDWLGEGDRVIG